MLIPAVGFILMLLFFLNFLGAIGRGMISSVPLETSATVPSAGAPPLVGIWRDDPNGLYAIGGAPRPGNPAIVVSLGDCPPDGVTTRVGWQQTQETPQEDGWEGQLSTQNSSGCSILAAELNANGSLGQTFLRRPVSEVPAWDSPDQTPQYTLPPHTFHFP
jgi:hypothetical protein